MEDHPSIGDVRKFAEEASEALGALDTTRSRGLREGAGDLEAVARVAELALFASSATVGECRVQEPYASLYPLITPDGRFQWRCTHDPPHSSP